MLYYTDFSSRLRIVQISSNVFCKCKCIHMEAITTAPAAAEEHGFLTENGSSRRARARTSLEFGRALGTLQVLDNYWLNGCFPLFCPLDVSQKYSKDPNKISSFLVFNAWGVGSGLGAGGRKEGQRRDFLFFF